MSDNKKWYYMRLKDTFFDSEEMKVLESLPDGYLYSNIYLKLCLLALKDSGKLTYKGQYPYTPQILSAIVGHPVGVVEHAITTLQQLGMIESFNNGVLFIAEMPTLIGHTSSENERKRDYRYRINAEKQGLLTDGGTTNGTNVPTNVPTEVHQSIENRDKSTEIKVKKKKKKSFIPPTPQEVESFAAEKNLIITGSLFCDFYQQNNWKDKNGYPINWKQKCFTWKDKNQKGGTWNGTNTTVRNDRKIPNGEEL